MPEKIKLKPENQKRASRIYTALDMGRYLFGQEESEAITDALADLRHLCDRHGLVFGDLDRMAHEHYTTERYVSQFRERKK